MTMNYSVETLHRIYNDDTGDYLEVGPDSDSAGLVEIRSYVKNVTKPAQRLVLHPDQVPLLVQVLRPEIPKVSRYAVSHFDLEGKLNLEIVEAESELEALKNYARQRPDSEALDLLECETLDEALDSSTTVKKIPHA